MKKFLLIISLFFTISHLRAQITTPQIKANFGVDADLRSNYFNNFVQSGNDDWFVYPGTPGTGKFMIDTTGAAAILLQYSTDLNFRRMPFYRTMSYPAYSIINNRLLIDAVMIRDYHGDDSTVFAAGASKNGQSPANWSCPLYQSIPDKNDILDMFVHVRREGPDPNYPLWMFGGLSIENTTGDRYFDFEMYQTDIYYDRFTQKFYGYGPDAGHTSWQFDAAGNVTQPGDIVFSAEYGSSTITALEARIWVDKANLSITPATFDWNGNFDGASAGAQYGYAGIKPKLGATFYTGIESASNTWAGSFGLIREDNSFITTYTKGQFMEFSVNLTVLGLDPVTLLGGACGMPFRRVLVKTRASSSFTAALKDFVGPFDFFLAPRAEAAAEAPILCGIIAPTTIQVTNPYVTSTYTWSTTDGHIVSSNVGTSITVDSPGTYIVTQTLQTGCSTYATDTVTVLYEPDCTILQANILDFKGAMENREAQLSWLVSENETIKYFDVERSTDGVHFTDFKRINSSGSSATSTSYGTTDDVHAFTSSNVYYRIKMVYTNGASKYSKIISLSLAPGGNSAISVYPNPAVSSTELKVDAANDGDIQIHIYDITGRLKHSVNAHVTKGISILNLTGLDKLPRGIYALKVLMDNEIYTQRMILSQ